jgi:hypothetical protein
MKHAPGPPRLLLLRLLLLIWQQCTLESFQDI